jgi:putative SOS response-associated peptidase YedK
MGSLGDRQKQPQACAMKNGLPFFPSGIWEIWHHPAGVDIRNFAIVTCAPNKLMATIYDRMLIILLRKGYERCCP